MIKLFTSRQPIIYLFLVLLAFFLKLPIFLFDNNITNSTNNYTFFTDLFFFLNQTKLESYLLGSSIVLLQSLHLGYVFEKHGVHVKSTFLPALGYILGASLFNGMDVHVTPCLIAQTPLLLATEIFFNLYKSGNIKENLFKAMLALGLGIVIYLPLAYLIPVFWICLFFIKIPSVRDFTIATAGALVPIYFVFVYFYFTGHLTDFLAMIESLTYFKKQIQFVETSSELVLLVCIGIIILYTSFKLYANYFQNNIKTRIIQQMLFVLSFVTLAILSFLLQFHYEHLMLFIIPFSYLFSYFFLGKWRFMLDEIIALFLLSFIILIRYNFL